VVAALSGEQQRSRVLPSQSTRQNRRAHNAKQKSGRPANALPPWLLLREKGSVGGSHRVAGNRYPPRGANSDQRLALDFADLRSEPRPGQERPHRVPEAWPVGRVGGNEDVAPSARPDAEVHDVQGERPSRRAKHHVINTRPVRGRANRGSVRARCAHRRVTDRRRARGHSSAVRTGRRRAPCWLRCLRLCSTRGLENEVSPRQFCRVSRCTEKP
jgi:hypothetical protein